MDNKVYSKKNKFKKNSTFKFNFNLKKQLLRTTKTSVLLLNNFENQKFIMLISSNESLEKLVKISSIYPKNKILFKPIQSGSCKGLNPFNNNNSIDYAFLICKDYNHHVFKNILESRKINLLNFKNALKTFLKNYSKLNREIGFVYNNINTESLLFKHNTFVLIDFEKAIFDEKLINSKKNIYNSKKNIKKLTALNLRNIDTYNKKVTKKTNKNKSTAKTIFKKDDKNKTIVKNDYLTKFKKKGFNLVQTYKKDITEKLFKSQNNIPKKSVSNKNIPKKSVSNKNIPKKSVSNKNIPKKTVSNKNIPKKSVSKNNIPKQNATTKITSEKENSLFTKLKKRTYDVIESSKKEISKELQSSQNDFRKTKQKIKSTQNNFKKTKENRLKSIKNMSKKSTFYKKKKNENTLNTKKNNAYINKLRKQSFDMLESTKKHISKKLQETQNDVNKKSSKTNINGGFRINNSNMKGGNKKLNYNKLKNIDNKFNITKYKELDNNDNYDIICILWLIYIAEKHLNNIPKPLILSNKDISYLKNNLKLHEKIDYLLKKDYFKFM